MKTGNKRIVDILKIANDQMYCRKALEKKRTENHDIMSQDSKLHR